MNYKLLIIAGVVIILLIGVGAALLMMRSSSPSSTTTTPNSTTTTTPSNSTSSTTSSNFYFIAFTQKGLAQVLNPFSQSQSFLGFTRYTNISTNLPQQVYYWEEIPAGVTPKYLFVPVNNGTVFVLDPQSFKVVETLYVGSSKGQIGFIGASFSPNGEYVALADGPSGILEVINVQTLQTVWKVTFLRANGATAYPCDVRWTPDGSELIVPMRFNETVDIINASNGQVVKSLLTLSPNEQVLPQPYMVSPNFQGTMVAVEYAGNNSVGFYSLPNLQLMGMVEMPGKLVPQRGVFTPDGQYYLEAPSNNDTVVVISTSNFQVVKEIQLPQINSPGLADIEIAPGDQYAYVVIHGNVNTGGMIVLISLSSLSVAYELPLTTAPAFVIPVNLGMANYLLSQVMSPPVTGLHC